MGVVNYININRHKGLGGSDLGIIMGESVSAIHNLWLLKTQQKEPDDLSNILAVQLGSETEKFNRNWFAQQTDKVVEDYPLNHVMKDFRMAHYDGWLPEESALIECKHTNQHNKMQHVKERYYAQIQHYLMMSELSVCYLSVIFGNVRWEYSAVPSHATYQDLLFMRQERFWDMVVKLEEPTEANTSWRLYE